MPGRFIYDSAVKTVMNGKTVNDTVWHRMPSFFTDQPIRAAAGNAGKIWKQKQ